VNTVDNAQLRATLGGTLQAVAATAFFATAAVLVRMVDGLPPTYIAAVRLGLAAGVMALFAIISKVSLRIQGRELGQLALVGAIAAAHFTLYIQALNLTTIAHTLLLVNLSPVLVAVYGHLTGDHRLKPSQYGGVLAAIGGVAVMVGFQAVASPEILMGDALALGSGLAYAVYSLMGRGLREEYSLPKYAFWVYLSAGALLLPLGLWRLVGVGEVGGLAGVAGTAAASFGMAMTLTRDNLLPLVLLGLLPTAFGHTLYNAALRRIQATYANLIATQEVTGGIILGFLVLGEEPTVITVLGAALALLGIYWVLRTESPRGRRRRPSAQA